MRVVTSNGYRHLAYRHLCHWSESHGRIDGDMGVTGERFSAAYAAAFRQYLAGGAERSLERAYELGRIAVAERLSLMQLAEAHHSVLSASLLERGQTSVTLSAAHS